jgi:hypothetical protein
MIGIGIPPEELGREFSRPVLSTFGTNLVMSVGQYHLTGQGQNGPNKIDEHWTAVYVPVGGKLKIRLLTAVDDPPKAE